MSLESPRAQAGSPVCAEVVLLFFAHVAGWTEERMLRVGAWCVSRLWDGMENFKVGAESLQPFLILSFSSWPASCRPVTPPVTSSYVLLLSPGLVGQLSLKLYLLLINFTVDPLPGGVKYV